MGGSPGPHPGGCVSQHAMRQTPPKQTATAACGTHPTGMHSCYQNGFPNLNGMVVMVLLSFNYRTFVPSCSFGLFSLNF